MSELLSCIAFFLLGVVTGTFWVFDSLEKHGITYQDHKFVCYRPYCLNSLPEPPK
jgi:hypothetical protein